ncbi:flagellar protein FliT [Vogesella indigofera]|uniref:Flagellar protein FliT n=1 Tax=Vogesella indigofera TaxID=45465 RepID=A0ABT5I7W0_VOGIN|nr:flagellar protein FliT [Vogesella indigofera]MDC7691975.1 flagellar protein FliT [Vogesella indigofera]
MADTSEQLLRQYRDLGLALLELARKEEWDTVFEQQLLRDDIYARLTATPRIMPVSGQMRAIVEEALEANQQLAVLLQGRRQELQSLLGNVSTQLKLSSAYR